MPDNTRMELLDEALAIDQQGPKEAAFLRLRYAANVPDTLYHYTTDAGLYGIMKSGRLRIQFGDRPGR